MTVARLHPDDLAALAESIAVRVLGACGCEPAAPARPPLIGAHEVALHLGVSDEWVRDHAEELGVYRLGAPGEDRRPRLRFDLERVMERLERSSARSGSRSPLEAGAAEQSQTRRRRRRTSEPGVQLLPVRGGER